MTESSAATAPPPAPSPSRAPESGEKHWGRRIIVGLVLVAIAVVLFIAGAAFMPRWWAQRIGDQVDGGSAQGVGVGLFYGFVFTLVPLIVLWVAFHKRRPIATWLLLTALAGVLAAPNLLTLGIVLGDGDAAHAGERILDTRANFFRASSLIGAIVAGLVMLLVVFFLAKRKRRKHATERAKDAPAPAAFVDSSPANATVAPPSPPNDPPASG